MIGLTLQELHRVYELCSITRKDNGNIKNKTCRALVKHIKFCEPDEFLQREEEGISMLLDLNNSLDALREARSLAAVAGATSPSSLMGERGEVAQHSERPTASEEDDQARLGSSPEPQMDRRSTQDGKIHASEAENPL